MTLSLFQWSAGISRSIIQFVKSFNIISVSIHEKALDKLNLGTRLIAAIKYPVFSLLELIHPLQDI